MPDLYVLGLDVGGTSTRVVLATTDGVPVGHGRAGGGNPVTYGVADAATAITAAVGRALGDTDPQRVAGAVVGLAGGTTHEALAREVVARVWAHHGMRCAVRIVGDTVVAYAAGTPAPDGTVIIAGTGAVAARISNRRLARLVDGHGWLLGDLGSGFWLGREAVRAALAALEERGPATPLTTAVLGALVGRDAPADPRAAVAAVIARVHADRPVALSRLAPLVTAAAADGDPVGCGIVAAGAAHLVDDLGPLRTVDDPSPIVLAGGLLTADTPVAIAVRATVGRRWPGAPVAVAVDGAAAAAWLAAVDVAGLSNAGAAALHGRLVPTI